jgi:membrane-bound inhibitor of C-type lysozyme
MNPSPFPKVHISASQKMSGREPVSHATGNIFSSILLTTSRQSAQRRVASFGVQTALIALGSMLALTACTKPRATASAYSCADGYTFTITYSNPDNAGDIAIFEDASGTTKLPRAVAASGAKYSNGATIFWSKGDEAMVTFAGDVQHKGCRVG